MVVPADDHGAPTRYGWGGGLGTLWHSRPDHGCAAVLLPPSLGPFEAFITGAESALTA